jgi:uncharacterized protein YbaR (Trm112 family)
MAGTPEPAARVASCESITRPAAATRAGITCPVCRGVRLQVYRTRHPAPGLCVRYRSCPDCKLRLRTRERIEVIISPGAKPVISGTEHED